MRRGVAFDHDRQVEQFGGVLDRGGEGKIVLQHAHRRHENMEPAQARLDAKSSADDRAGGFAANRRSRLEIRRFGWASGWFTRVEALPEREGAVGESLARGNPGGW